MDLDDRVYSKNWSEYKRLLKKKGDDPVTEEMIFFMFILKISKKIEVAVHPPALEKPITKEIYFPLMPETFYLEEKTRDDTIKDIDVENRRMDFQRRYPQYFIEMEQNYRLSLSSPFIYAISKNDTLKKLKLFYYFIGLALNVLVILFYKLTGGSTDPDKRNLTAFSGGNKLITWVSAIFSGMTFINFLIWLFFRAGAEYKSTLPKYSISHPTAQMPPNFGTKVEISIFWVFFNSSEALNFLLHSVFALMSIFTNPFYTSLHLLLFVNISTTAKYVLQAAFAHINQLGATFLLSIFTIWSFAILNTIYFSGSFDVQDISGANIDVCSNMFRCLIYNLNFGLRNGGGIADNHSAYAFGGIGNQNDIVW